MFSEFKCELFEVSFEGWVKVVKSEKQMLLEVKVVLERRFYEFNEIIRKKWKTKPKNSEV